MSLHPALDALQRGDAAAATRLLRHHLAQVPGDAEAWITLAAPLVAAGRAGPALGLAERALAVDPASDLLRNNAIALADAAGEKRRLLIHLGRALERNDDDNLRLLHAATAVTLGELGIAAAGYRRALGRMPGEGAPLGNLGAVLLARGKPLEAEPWLKRAAQLRRDDPILQVTLAKAAHAVSHPIAARRHARSATALVPSDLAALLPFAALADTAGNGDAAAAWYTRALAVDRDCLPARRGRAKAFADACRFALAERDLRAATALTPADGEVLSDHATVDFGLGRRDRTIRIARRRLAIGANPAAAWELGQALAAQGDYESGLPLMESRWQLAEFVATSGRDFPWPRWSGKIEPGLRLLLWSEQGYGDALNFVRYAPILAAQGLRVTVETLAPLADLFASLGVAVIRRGERLPEVDRQAPVMSLPHLCGTRLGTIPAEVPYLTAPAERRARWTERIAALPTPRIGLCWQGNPTFRRDLERSPGFEAIRPLLDRRPFAGLVRDAAREHRHPNLFNLGPDFADFADTAACLEMLDLVVTSDTALAHLAGALGRPTFLLLHHAPDWRWHEHGNASPWYPTMRLFRQPAPGDWVSVVAEIQTALDDFCS